MTTKYYQPTQAVLDNIQRGIAISNRYPRESYVAKQRLQQVEFSKSFKFDINTISTMYHTLAKLEKSLDFDKRLWDGGCDDNVMSYYAFGGKSGLAWSKSILKQEGILNSHRTEITKAQTEESGVDAVGTLGVIKSVDKTLMQVTYVSMNVGTDLHGDFTSEEEVRKAKESFNKSLQNCYLFHSVPTTTFSVIESYLAPTDLVLNGHFVQKGTWLMTLQVHDDALWEQIVDGRINGISIGAMAIVEAIE
jgi:hypothetical protein